MLEHNPGGPRQRMMDTSVASVTSVTSVTPPSSRQVFSRNSEDNTTKYPDIAAMLPRAVAAGVSSFILDSEAVAVNPTTGAIQPFQAAERPAPERPARAPRPNACPVAVQLAVVGSLGTVADRLTG